ncbi:MAG: DNA translocase FtsK 4TM domain-containing protein [Alistipes sp.]|nr:DNA translocase FtsK 4TM domain-containing protein [Alistipes sp.]
MTGFIFLAVGIFLICSLVSYLFYWRDDMSVMTQGENPLYKQIYNNVCGSTGARLGQMLVGDGFGVFALIIPLYCIVLGWRLFRSKHLRLIYITVIACAILILGSMTLAYIFGTRWDLYESGLGGSYGLALNGYLDGYVGRIGTLLVIIAGWVLTGLFINRNFLRSVDNAGEHVAEGVSGAASWIWTKLRHKRQDADDEVADDELMDEMDDEEATTPITPPSPQPVAEPVVKPAPQPTPQPMPQPVVQDSPFMTVDRGSKVEVDDNGNIVVVGPAAAAATATTAATPVVIDDYPFKDPDAPIEEPLTDEQLAAAAMATTTATAEEAPQNSVFTTVPRTDVEAKVAEEQDEPEGMVITVEQRKNEVVSPDDITAEIYDPMRDLSHYVPPMPQLLTDHKVVAASNDQEIFENKERIRETLLNFGIPIRSMHATVGPTVTLYEIVQEQGVKISKIQGLENDIAQSLKALGIRIIAPIPGRGTIGIEVPNITKQTVSMYSAICSREFQESKAQLPVVIGRTIQNDNYTFDLAKMPHLLVAGATGQGKSVGLNAIITSLLYRKHPAELKFVLIDPKMVEFSLFNKLEKHFLAKMESEDEAIVTDPRKAVYTLNSLCAEMENRLELCKQAHTRNIVEYNEKFTSRRLNPEHGHRFLPYIVVVIDEFADLIMTAKEVEAPVMRLAQKARAVGIHLIVATQRPDVRVITGGIKANFPARIAFRVMQMTDSRTIIDQPGANQLIGRGDMLLSNGGELTRIQCAFVDTPEVERIVDHIGRQQGYPSAYALPDYTPEQGGGEASVSFGSEESGVPQKYDPKFGEIAREAVTSGIISTSMIQRNFEVGFNRAGRIMLQLERAGIVGPQIGSKPREIKYYDLPSLEARLQELGIF